MILNKKIMIKINYLFFVLLFADLYGIEKIELKSELLNLSSDETIPKLPSLSKRETIKNFLFDEFHKGLGVGLVGAGFFYGGMKIMSYKSPFFKKIQQNKKLINTLTLITAVFPTVKNFYTYKKFTTVENLFLIKQLNESDYLGPDPLKVLAIRILKLSNESKYDFIFPLLTELSFNAIKNMRKNINEKAFLVKEKEDIDEIFKAAIREHFLESVKKLKDKGEVNQKDYDSIIKFFLLDVNNIEANSEKIHKLINSFKANNSGKAFRYHPFEQAIIKIAQERKQSFTHKEYFDLCLLLFINKSNDVSLASFLFILLTKYLSIDKYKRNVELENIWQIIISNRVDIETIKNFLNQEIQRDKNYKKYLESLSKEISDENNINKEIFQAVLTKKSMMPKIKQSGAAEKIINFFIFLNREFLVGKTTFIDFFVYFLYNQSKFC